MSVNAMFIIEGSPFIDAVREHIAECRRVQQEVKALADELGVKEARTNVWTGVLTAVRFPGPVHPDFTKPDRKFSCSWPRKRTAWAERFAAQRGREPQTKRIQKIWPVPTTINYDVGREGGWGRQCIGNLLTECGFLWLSREGPYAMWVPDVEYEVARIEREFGQVEEPVRSFRLAFDGLRRIHQEEWDILVLQHQLAQKNAQAPEVPA